MYGLIATITALLSDLLGRFTTTRADKIDLLDATISSRAPAATAVSKAIWTDALAELLASSAGQPIVPKAPVSGGIVRLETPVSSPSAWVDIVNLTSADGYINKLYFTGASFFSFELIIDGVVVWSVTDGYGLKEVIGDYLTSLGIVIEGTPIHFRSSLRMRAKGNTTVSCSYIRTR